MTRIRERGKTKLQAEKLGLRWNIRRTHNWEHLRICLDAITENKEPLWPKGINLWHNNLNDYTKPCPMCHGSGVNFALSCSITDTTLWPDCLLCDGKGGNRNRWSHNYPYRIECTLMATEKISAGSPVALVDTEKVSAIKSKTDMQSFIGIAMHDVEQEHQIRIRLHGAW